MIETLRLKKNYFYPNNFKFCAVKKNHKKGFPNSPSFRLINKSKSQIGKISKHILDKINKLLLNNRKVNQWKNTSDAISWFKNINNKKQSSFVNFDIECLYSSISEKTFNR